MTSLDGARTATPSRTVAIEAESDIVAARQAGRDTARQLGFGMADQTRLATAISELARNVIRYAGEGTCTIFNESNRDMARVRVAIEDHGPGIPDVDEAMAEGFSTNNSLGVGLPAAKKLVNEFEIKSEPGHTIITVAIVRTTP